MLTERNNRTHQQQQYVSSSSSTSSSASFTANQWQELENQVLTFRYLMSGVPVPPALMSSVITSPPPSISTSSSSSSMFPLHQQLPLGLSCFQVGYGYGYGRKVDPEPGRCKRTDGKKWRCSKEAHPDSKYCERHMNRGKGKSKKQQQSDALSNSKAVTSSNTYPNPNPTVKTSCLPYPAVISYCAETQPTYPNKFQAASSNSNSNSNNNNNSTSTLYPFLPAQSLANHRASSDRDDVTSTPHWLGLDGVADLHDHHPIPKDLRYSNQMKGGRVEESRMMGSEGSSQEQQEEKLAVDQQEHDSQKLYHHFLGDWPMKSKTSYDIGLFSRSN